MILNVPLWDNFHDEFNGIIDATTCFISTFHSNDMNRSRKTREFVSKKHLPLDIERSLIYQS